MWPKPSVPTFAPRVPCHRFPDWKRTHRSDVASHGHELNEQAVVWSRDRILSLHKSSLAATSHVKGLLSEYQNVYPRVLLKAHPA